MNERKSGGERESEHTNECVRGRIGGALSASVCVRELGKHCEMLRAHKQTNERTNERMGEQVESERGTGGCIRGSKEILVLE